MNYLKKWKLKNQSLDLKENQNPYKLDVF
jgi:hypothetical protein